MILTSSDDFTKLKVGMRIHFRVKNGHNTFGVHLTERLETSSWRITAITSERFGEYFGFENCTYPNESFRDPASNIGSFYDVIIEGQVESFTNKGRKTCAGCGCKTEMKRDFGDMSIREFCPRCKV
jgi:hypothetical protein